MTTPIALSDTFGTWLTRINEVIGITNGLGSASAIAITGGTVNGTAIGLTTPASAKFTNLTATGTVNFQGTTIQLDANSLDGTYIDDGSITAAKANVSGGNLAAWQTALGVVSLSAANTFTNDITFNKDTTLFAAQNATEGGEFRMAPGTTYSAEGNVSFDISGRTLRILNNNTQNWTMSLSNSGTGIFSLDVEGSIKSGNGTFVGTGTDIILQPVAGTTAMTVKNTKRVGIGEITSPQAALHVDTATVESSTVSVLSTDYAIALSAAEGGTNFMNWGICSTWGTTVQAAINPIDLGSGGAQGWAFYTGNSTAISQALLLGSDQTATFGAQVRVADGLISAPGFSFSGDTNTGMWRPAADTLELVTGGARRIRLSNSGHFMVGTDTPASQFTMVTNFGGTDGLTIRNDGNSVILNLQDATYATNGTASMLLTSTDLSLVSGIRSFTLKTGSSATERMKVTDAGAISFSNSTSFDVTSTSSTGGINVIASTNPYLNLRTSGAGTDLKNLRLIGRTDGMLQFQKVNDAGNTTTDLLSITTTGCILTGTRTTAQTGYTSSGDISLQSGAKIYAKNTAKFWVNFNGNGTVAIRDQFNVTSITDNGVGSYVGNLTNAMADANYACVGSAGDSASYGDRQVSAFPLTTSTVRIFSGQTATTSMYDSGYISVVGYGS